jgi:hypothetical protein
VFTFEDPDDDSADRYWMLYAGYQDVIAQPVGNGLVGYTTRGARLGIASSASPDADWARVQAAPVPLTSRLHSEEEPFTAGDAVDSPRAFFINGRVHVFYTDDGFENPDGLGGTVSGIGLGISPFPVAGGGP